MKTYVELLAEFREFIKNDSFAIAKWQKTIDGTATYQDANAYANYIAQKWNAYISNEFGSVTLIETETQDIYKDIRQSIEKSYSEAAYYAKNVQKCVNNRAGIGLNAIEPALDEDRMNNLFKMVSEKAIELPNELIENVITSEVVENLAKSAIVDTVHANAKFQSEAGINAYVIRSGGAGCCNWCADQTGKWEYDNVPKDAWAFHKGCTCTIEYKPSKYKEATTLNAKYGRWLTA